MPCIIDTFDRAEAFDTIGTTDTGETWSVTDVSGTPLTGPALGFAQTGNRLGIYQPPSFNNPWALVDLGTDQQTFEAIVRRHWSAVHYVGSGSGLVFTGTPARFFSSVSTSLLVGDLLVMAAFIQLPGTISPAVSGWVQHHTTTTGSYRTYVFSKRITTAGVNSDQFNCSAAGLYVGHTDRAYRDVGNVESVAGQTGTGTILSTPTVSPVTDHSVAVSAFFTGTKAGGTGDAIILGPSIAQNRMGVGLKQASGITLANGVAIRSGDEAWGNSGLEPARVATTTNSSEWFGYRIVIPQNGLPVFDQANLTNLFVLRAAGPASPAASLFVTRSNATNEIEIDSNGTGVFFTNGMRLGIRIIGNSAQLLLNGVATGTPSTIGRAGNTWCGFQGFRQSDIRWDAFSTCPSVVATGWHVGDIAIG